MILISHNCLAGHLYHLIGQKYACPFIWTVIDFNSIKTLITEWDKINFKNYRLEKDDKWNFSIIIDDKIKVQYVHYKFDSTSSILVKKGPGDICYNRIWEYIISKYEERINRMNKETSKPIFCIANFNTIFPDAIYTEEQLKELEKYENVKILKGCEKFEPMPTAIQFYNNFFEEMMYNNKRIIITMTSWAKRIKNVPKVVFSILSNTITPDSIELNLSSDEFINKEKDLPEELILLNQNGIININWVKENTGVFKKLIPTLQKYKNEDYYLISCDDDWLYNKDFIQVLLTRLNEGYWYSLQNANQVIGNSTIYRSIIFDSDFWEIITDELISIGISDYYITKYLVKKQKYQQVEKHNKIYDFAKPFNQIFPNSHNKTNGNGDYDTKRIKMAYNIINKILEKI